MKKRIGFLLKWMRNAIAAILFLLAITLLFFNIQAALRETKTRVEAAPSIGRFIQAGDIELFIQEMGPSSGPAVVFIHGAGAWGGLWRETMTALSEAGFRCIAIDVPPFGFSESSKTAAYGRVDQAKRIIAALDALQISRAILIGHSFGGGATVETALMIPNRIEAMVLVDVGGLGLNTDPTQPSNQPSVVTSIFAVRPVRNAILASTLTNPLLSKKLLETLILDPADATQARINILQQPLVLEHRTDTLGDWLFYTLTTQEVSLSSDPANYQTLDMPVLVVWGESDTIVPLAEGKHLASMLPRSQLLIMEQVNHIPQIEDTATFNDSVLAFLAPVRP
jgi:pimeloyl-ACP methyl ester carboxylesterase